MSRYTRFISASLVFALAACGGGTGPYGGGTNNLCSSARCGELLR